MGKNAYRTLWLSDIHLGNRDCKVDYLLDFLTRHQADTLILVGDIVDLWSLKSRYHWPESHTRVIRLLLEQAEAGCRIVYIPGNHDEAVRKFIQFNPGNVELAHRYVHTSANGQRILALHGDEFDSLVCHSRLTSLLGDLGYDLLLFMNRWLNVYRRMTKQPYWSLASYLKARVEKANVAIARFRRAAITMAKHKDVDAIVCGHIHHPEITEEDDILYLNDGDWIENCTFLAEHHDGVIELIRWTEQAELLNSSDKFRVKRDTPRVIIEKPQRQADKVA
ncbi:UDP-2,3-diacylglucosamine diphosphatase [Photobacterium sp. GJ3]|uniref:UDP-2,3-diacylglucosamine diphosphatase n=1 Tax=Photobacterium sp. GJ3 TaxID=2829502 RepID=UPI001B8B5AEF|nr:UDP-2,3-diacylglucosamine diphosphatase [Photobacterium sp. GJ3]QUJ68473.1 UDP-2,3-diacylglucosamine diphosphatase [Photobacterium sp. GJ3]